MKNRNKVIAAAFAVVAIALLAYALFMGEPTDSSTTDHPGMWDPDRAYATEGVAVIVVTSFLIAVAIMFILLREEYVPLPPSMTPPPPPPPREQAGQVRTDVPEASKTVEVADGRAPKPAEDVAVEENYLVLRLLTGDERTMFKAIMDTGGEALQKDLMQRTKMSNAKVSRVLDKLEQKGVVSKERYGSTNKVRIKLRT